MHSAHYTLLTLFSACALSLYIVDHEILLRRLQISFGRSGNFLSWLGSFLPCAPVRHRSLLHTDWCWVLSFTSFTLLRSISTLLPLLYWITCTLMTFRLTCQKTQFIWLEPLLQLDAITSDFPFYLLTCCKLLQELTANSPPLAPNIHLLFYDSYYQLRHLTPSSQSDYSLHCCCSLYVGLPVEWLGYLDQVLLSATHFSGRISKLDHVSSHTLDVFHWLSLQ